MRSQTLPKLTVIPASVKARKRYHYYLHLPAEERRKALAAGIISEQRKRKITLRNAALAKKARLNVLRIYRRYRFPSQCRIITRDMKWIDKTYLTKSKTNDICAKKQ
jgi:hypothetical protein